MQKLKLRLAAALAAVALAACVDTQSPEVRAPEASSPAVARQSRDIPAVPKKVLKVSRKDSKRARKEYNVTLRFLTETSPAQEAAFTAAVARWEEQITKDKPDDTEGLPPNYCFGGTPAFGTIDDLLIDVALLPIDGPGTPEEGNILGFAGPCAVRTSDLLSVYGVMVFDTYDMESMEEDDILENVILHEMGHVLGVGSLWNLAIPGLPERFLLQGEGTGNPFFLGKRANKAYKHLGGKGLVPVEGDFGPGTADAHWDDDTFGNELMTGFIGLGESPLSDITAGSLTDLGYEARDKGDQYELPTLADAAMSASVARLPGIDLSKQEILVTPKFFR